MRLSMLLAFLPMASLACGEIIGIQEAYHDESLDPELKAESEGAGGSDDGGSACAEYCDAIESSCSGPETQYADRQVCLDVCALWPEGSAEPTQENSLGCRMHQAELAGIEPEVHCTLAGPAGGGECGSTCESFCAIMMAVCTPETAADHYPDTETCLADCLTVTDEGEFSTDSSQGYSSGLTVQCRLYHVAAATQDPGRHCSHAIGSGPCG